MRSVLALTIKKFPLLILVSVGFAWSKNVPYQETLGSLFSGCKVEKENVFLSPEQKKQVEEKSGQKLYSQMALRYHVDCASGRMVAYIDSHIVRTLNETVVVVLNENGTIEDFRISSFMEPSEYIPPAKWIAQVLRKGPQDQFQLHKEIDGLSGATLSAHAIVNSSKRILQLHQVLTAPAAQSKF